MNCIFPSFNYIGSKMKLLNFIETCIKKYTGKELKQINGFADPFSGTGIVDYYLLKNGCKKIFVNDIQHYAYIVSSVWCLNDVDIIKIRDLINNINTLNNGITSDDIEMNDENFITNNYTELGDAQRMYFTVENGYKIDKTRQNLQKLKQTGIINTKEFNLLLKILLYAVAKVSNIASVYGAYLKYYKTSSLKPLTLDITLLDKLLKADKTINIMSTNTNVINLLETNDLSNYEIVYIDPPYVSNRNYDSNYHILETISKYDHPEIRGKTGIRNDTTTKSTFCSKRDAYDSFKIIFERIKSKYIFLSYSSESILSKEEMTNLLESTGYKDIQIFEKEYTRFRSNSLTDPDQTVTEYLFCGKNTFKNKNKNIA